MVRRGIMRERTGCLPYVACAGRTDIPTDIYRPNGYIIWDIMTPDTKFINRSLLLNESHGETTAVEVEAKDTLLCQ